MNNTLLIIIIVLVAFLLSIGVNELYLRLMAKRSAKTITEDEFKEIMRRGQIIDVREKDSFNAGHILGARSIPYSLFKQSSDSLRKDMPVFLYEQKKSLSIRAANVLRKKGFTDVYILKGGYNSWTGKIKKS